jgi:hypothetical protein
MSAEVLYLIVLTQVFYLVWNVKSIIFYGRPSREKLFADADVGELSSDEWAGLKKAENRKKKDLVSIFHKT